MNEILTPAVILKLVDLAKDGGLILTLIIVLIVYFLEVRRNNQKDKIIAAKDEQNADMQLKMLEALGEVKTAVSNSLLLLEMITRGRK